MATYDLDATHHPYQHREPELDDATLDGLWDLFVAIGDFWQNVHDPNLMRSSFVVFVENRVRLDPNYAAEYTNAVEVIAELTEEHGAAGAYEFLFTDPAAAISPPRTKLARARQLVSNEFVALQLSLGGFRRFGGAVNYLGYISGPNIAGDPPYRTYAGEAS